MLLQLYNGVIHGQNSSRYFSIQSNNVLSINYYNFKENNKTRTNKIKVSIETALCCSIISASQNGSSSCKRVDSPTNVKDITGKMVKLSYV